ncbi:MAG TPA: formimidoylglutamase, partial [Arthrobacter sp.]
MAFTLPAVDVPPQPWTGRFDGDGPEHRRWWQAVHPFDPATDEAPRPG